MIDQEGNELGCLQETLPIPVSDLVLTGKPLSASESEFEITVVGDNFRYLLSKQTGMLTSIVANGNEQLYEPVKTSYYRAPTDNDRHIKALWERGDLWQGENFDCTFTKIYSCSVSGNKVVFSASSSGISRKPFFYFDLSYEFFTDGTVRISLNGKIRENVAWLPRLGFEFKLPYDKNKFTYFGNGPYESYRDMTHHGIVSFHKSTADREYVNYVRPQEHGNHTDCKVLNIKDSLKFRSQSMEISVLHHSIEALASAEHTDELKKSDGTHVRIDRKVSGIGSNSCGPELDRKYRLDEKDISFDFILSV